MVHRQRCPLGPSRCAHPPNGLAVAPPQLFTPTGDMYKLMVCWACGESQIHADQVGNLGALQPAVACPSAPSCVVGWDNVFALQPLLIDHVGAVPGCTRGNGMGSLACREPGLAGRMRAECRLPCTGEGRQECSQRALPTRVGRLMARAADGEEGEVLGVQGAARGAQS